MARTTPARTTTSARTASKRRGTCRSIEFRELVRQAIADSGLSQTAVAELAAMHPVGLNRYLSGRRDLNGASLQRLFAALNIHPV